MSLMERMLGRTETPSKPKTMPSLTQGTDDFCHLTIEGRPGSACGGPEQCNAGRIYTSARQVPRICPDCGRPTCPACISICATYERSGIVP